MKKLIVNVIIFLGSIFGLFTVLATPANAFNTPQKTASYTGLPSSENSNPSEGFIDSLQRGVGWLMTVLAILTLFILVYGGILMITASGDEEKYKKGFTIMKQTAIGLIFLGLSRLFIMLVFFVIGAMTTAS